MHSVDPAKMCARWQGMAPKGFKRLTRPNAKTHHICS